MAEKSFSRVQLLTLSEAILAAIALVLSIVSSQTAYPLTDLWMIPAACAATIVICAAVTMLHPRLNAALRDLLLLVTAFLNGFSLCTLIRGRILLIGYIYFSDLESSNPIAIRAMNLTIAACVCYLLAIAVNCAVGIKRQKND